MCDVLGLCGGEGEPGLGGASGMLRKVLVSG